jgi:amino acid transporter
MKLRYFFGKPLSNAVAHEHRLRKLKALPILSSDALSSVAYGTEEILTVLVLGGTAALALSMHIAIAICILLALLGASYYQTIEAYPSGGGAFAVSRDNLGEIPSLLAAAALLIDYLLTVAVSVSAGILALTSAFPALMPHTVLLCVISILFIAWMNLRGVRESAGVFAYPTYIFIFVVILLMAIGFWKIHFHPQTVLAFQNHHGAENILPHDNAFVAISIYLILKAFSQGCSALTGIECIANAVSVFKQPEVSNARKTLIMMVTLLGIMFFGITYVANALHVIPNDKESVLSQIGHFVFHHSVLYYILQAATTAILLLAANTAFTGFPRLASVLSEYKFLPKQFSSPGDRLSFSNGIASLAAFSCILVIIFRGNVNSLIPLYSIGVYLAFSLSQLGMVRHWLRKRCANWQFKALINALGCIATITALGVIIVSKFLEGAWITVFLIGGAPIIFYIIHKHYNSVDQELSVKVTEANQYLYEMAQIKPKVVVPISRMHRGTLAALNLAQHVSDDVIAVSVDTSHKSTEKLRNMWSQLNINVPLVVLPSPYRETISPLKRFIREQDRREPERGLCMIVMPEAIPSKWWHYILHNQRATLLKASLLLNRKHKGSTRIFVDVPYQLK